MDPCIVVWISRNNQQDATLLQNFLFQRLLKAQHVSSGIPLIIRSSKLYLQPLVYICKPEAANTVYSSWWWAVCRSKHVESSINVGIKNSITRLHLIGYSYWFILTDIYPVGKACHHSVTIRIPVQHLFLTTSRLQDVTIWQLLPLLNPSPSLQKSTIDHKLDNLPTDPFKLQQQLATLTSLLATDFVLFSI